MHVVLEWMAVVLGPGVIAARRGWWFLCCASGWYQAAQAGQTVDDKAAFAMGRSQVIATLASAGKMAFDRVEWAAVGAGLALAWKNGHEHLRVARKGVQRDLARFWAWVVRRPWEKHEHALPDDTRQSLAQLDEFTAAEGDDAAVATGQVLIGLERRRAVLAARLTDVSTPSTVDEVLEHNSIRERLLTHYRENPADAIANQTATGLLSMTPGYAPPRLLGAVAGFGLMPKVALGLGVAVVALGFGLKHEIGEASKAKEALKTATTSLANFQHGVTERDQRITQLREEVSAQNVQCVTETKEAADRREAQTRRRLAAEAKAKGRIDEASSGAARPFNLDDRLRALSADDGGSGAAGGGTPAS